MSPKAQSKSKGTWQKKRIKKKMWKVNLWLTSPPHQSNALARKSPGPEYGKQKTVCREKSV